MVKPSEAVNAGSALFVDQIVVLFLPLNNRVRILSFFRLLRC